MFSKISDYLKTGAAARDTQPLPVRRDKEKNDHRQHGADSAVDDDDMLFSIEAIRALLTGMTLPAEQENQLEAILAGLDDLDAQGIKNIPVRLGQSIYQAVMDALPTIPRG